MQPKLESIVSHHSYEDLPETWRVPDDTAFSAGKALYDYQVDALKKAAKALHLYFSQHEKDHPRKAKFSGLYGGEDSCLAVHQYETKHAKREGKTNPIYNILSQHFLSEGGVIPAPQFINRMSFWMATGSGKTLVMVKLLEYLHALMKHGEIPKHPILLLAPSDHLIKQIQTTVAEFNQTGLNIAMVPLRQLHRPQRQALYRETLTIYYHRSDNISDVQKDALTDYRIYANEGKWYILLDEAHKGGKEHSKRQAYYAIMARQGFLFNFSATFTDEKDTITTVKKYNLEDFVKHGHGKNIYLNQGEYRAFKERRGADDALMELNQAERKRIVLKSLLTLAYVSNCAKHLRQQTKLGEALYHNPLMLTLVNSVNTSIENDKNDLWAFFQTLREIAANEVPADLFAAAKKELAKDWHNKEMMFGKAWKMESQAMEKATLADLREAVFHSRGKGALQCIRSKDSKELAFQLKSAQTPFALIRIGTITKWSNDFLRGYEESDALQAASFFAGLNAEDSPITILMGSRSFFESWDSTRPNVINFINIGGSEAKKFVIQAIGRGVRIKTLPGPGGRRRCGKLPEAGVDAKQKARLQKCSEEVHPVETLYLFATNRKAICAVLDGLDAEKQEATYRLLEGVEKAPLLQIAGKDMPLLVPYYKARKDEKRETEFSMNAATQERLQQWLSRTPDSVLMVRDGLSTEDIKHLRAMPKKVRENENKSYARLPFLQQRLLAYLAEKVKVADGVRPLDEANDIIHFRNIRVESQYAGELARAIDKAKAGASSDEEVAELAVQLHQKKITREQFNKKVAGEDEVETEDGLLTIKKLANHYYLPVIIGKDRAKYIQHIIKVPSEVAFLDALQRELNAEVVWDAWMFSKLDESLDEINIPYYDARTNEYRRFLPDFIFWLCNSKQKVYRIVFVDPKGTEHTHALGKIDGYEKLFKESDTPRLFRHKDWQVSVHLLYFNENRPAARRYASYWIDTPAKIFQQ